MEPIIEIMYGFTYQLGFTRVSPLLQELVLIQELVLLQEMRFRFLTILQVWGSSLQPYYSVHLNSVGFLWPIK